MGALDGKVAAVTGASSGIGQATAVELARAGAKVSLAARREDNLERIREHIASEGGDAFSEVCDVTVEEQANRFIERTNEELGALDILVNNAGVMLLGPIEGADTDEWRRMVEVNVLGLLYCTHAALPVMREAGGGHIVNVSSTAGRRASFGAAVYNLTKFGVTGFSEALRQEALHSNIRVTAIEPGYVATELVSHNRNPLVQQAAEQLREEIGEVLEPEDIASAIAYCVSQPQRVAVNELLVRPTRQRT